MVATSFNGDYIEWFENDGEQNFTQHRIIENFNQAKVIDIAHIDGDDDYDFVAAAGIDGKISWFENDGFGDFTEHVIIENWEGSTFVMAKDHLNNTDLDIDGDGDTDILASSVNPGNTISWFENDGNQNFTEHIIKDNWYWTRYQTAGDIDKDGDMDIIGTAKSGEVIWFENDGNQNFTENIIISDWGEPSSVKIADIDEDGDIDIAATSVGANEVVWFENDGDNNFVKNTIKTGHNGAISVIISDIDNDTDLDILSIAWIGGIASIFENDGDQNFTEHIFSNSANDLIKLFPIDLDSDGDLDILGAKYSAPNIRWWENMLGESTSIPHKLFDDNMSVEIYPNPCKENVFIKISNPESSEIFVNVYNTTGQKVISKKIKCFSNTLTEKIGISNFPEGTYYAEIISGQSVFDKKITINFSIAR
jgi:hypothetical protein